MMSSLSRKKDDMVQRVKAELEQAKDGNITHDGWTSLNTESYQTVTAHFVTQDWELRSVVLETKKVANSVRL